MTFFEQELRRMFDHDAVFEDTRFVGDACYGRLTDDIRVKINFITGMIMDHYEALKVTLINRKEGQIDSAVIKFQDLWGLKKISNSSFSDGLSPYIWRYDDRPGWYIYQPSQAEYKQLAEAVRTYVEVFQEPVQNQKMGQTMG